MSPIFNSRASPRFWMVALAIVASVGWLLPNHHLPWTSFHAEAWVSLGMIALGGWMICRGGATWRIQSPILFVASVATIPLFQYAFGLVIWSGNAWLSSLYLSAFCLALVIGANLSKGPEVELLQVLFLSICLAATISVGLQFLQWLDVDSFGIWLMNTGQVRPSANFGQPNNLATLQLWCVMGIGWWWSQKRLSGWVALFWASFILFGIALTQSRTAWLNIVIVWLLLVFLLRGTQRQQLAWAGFGLLSWLGICVAAISIVNAVFLLDGQPSTMVRLSEPLRPLAWQIFLQAVIERPYFGYGWDQTGQAHLAMSLASPSLGVHFGQAHNIILDFFIWSGIPLGLIICGVLIFSIYRTFRGLNVGSDLFVFACLLIVGVHGMLELPLHYAYFLVPSGFFWGVLLGKSTFPSIVFVPRYVVVISLMTVTVMSALVIRDYFEVEVRFRDMLHEKARIGTNHPGLLPEVVVLNQLRESIALARYDPEENAAPDDLVWAERVAKESPSMGNIYKLALLLAKNGKKADATAWLQRACAVMSKTECVTLSKVWQQQVEKDQRLTNVFPSEVLK